jgi:Peptidase M61 N-terminal domain
MMSSLWMKCAGAALAVAVGGSAARAQTAPITLSPITLSVDLTDAPRKILHATEVMPVTAGKLTVVYPKWIPGEHGPQGQSKTWLDFLLQRMASR